MGVCFCVCFCFNQVQLSISCVKIDIYLVYVALWIVVNVTLYLYCICTTACIVNASNRCAITKGRGGFTIHIVSHPHTNRAYWTRDLSFLLLDDSATLNATASLLTTTLLNPFNRLRIYWDIFISALHTLAQFPLWVPLSLTLLSFH